MIKKCVLPVLVTVIVLLSVVTLCQAQVKPDLKVYQMSIGRYDNETNTIVPITGATTGQEIRLICGVENRGSAFPQQFVIKWLIDGTMVYQYTNVGMTAGQKANKISAYTVNLKPGTHQYSCDLDSYKAVAESDETNNTATLNFQVTEPIARPDLKINQVFIAKPVLDANQQYVPLPSPMAGQAVFLVCAVGNAGTAPVKTGGRVSYRIDGNEVAYQEAPAMSVGGMGHLAMRYTMPPLPRTAHTYSCVIDSANAIAESNENNNVGMVSFPLGDPPVPIKPGVPLYPPKPGNFPR